LTVWTDGFGCIWVEDCFFHVFPVLLWGFWIKLFYLPLPIGYFDWNIFIRKP